MRVSVLLILVAVLTAATWGLVVLSPALWAHTSSSAFDALVALWVLAIFLWVWLLVVWVRS